MAQPALAQVIAGNWLVESQSSQLGFLKMRLALLTSPSGQLEFRGSLVGQPVEVHGIWSVSGDQIRLSGEATWRGRPPAPYTEMVTFTSWSYAELTGISMYGEKITCRRQD